MGIDIMTLSARVADRAQPTPDQQLEADLYAALKSALDELEALKAEDAQKQISDLSAENDDLRRQLAAAGAQLSLDQQQLADAMAADAATIAGLQDQRDHLLATNSGLSVDNALLTQKLAKAQADVAVAQQSVVNLTAQLNSASTALATANATIVSLNAQIALLKTAPADRPPEWKPMPTVSFALGVPGEFNVGPFVSDPDGDPLAITKNAIALPPGVIYDSVNKKFVYDGKGVAASTSGNVLTADDGRA